MRWVRYTVDTGGQTDLRFGIVENESVVEVDGSPFGTYERTSTIRPLSEVRLSYPVTPRTFYAVGLNYLDHIMEQAERRGTEPNIPEQADVGYRANNALIAHEEPIVIPSHATEAIEYEGELVVVIGKEAKHLSEADALSCVLGYTIGNDVSERTWQRSDRTLWRAKNTDTFKPMGPWIETEVDLDRLKTRVRVNGEEKIVFDTNNMLFGVEHYISRITSVVTLYPGDVIWMGTEGKAEPIKDGDRVDIEIEGIGVLSNPVVRES
jgi:2-keto-4-pentenoate hydratase/2-oxohepta-3-ene-1,7-dioic acid hydratase in catechol pathway